MWRSLWGACEELWYLEDSNGPVSRAPASCCQFSIFNGANCSHLSWPSSFLCTQVRLVLIRYRLAATWVSTQKHTASACPLQLDKATLATQNDQGMKPPKPTPKSTVRRRRQTSIQGSLPQSRNGFTGIRICLHLHSALFRTAWDC